MKIKDQRRNKKNMKTDENKNMTSKSIEYSNSGTKNEIYSNTIYLKKEEKSQNNQSNLTLKGTRK